MGNITGYKFCKRIRWKKIDFTSIDRLITISCIGFFAPGLDYELIKEFNISLGVKRTNIGFMGCAASRVISPLASDGIGMTMESARVLFEIIN